MSNVQHAKAKSSLLIIATVVGLFMSPFMVFSSLNDILEVGKFSAAQVGGSYPDGWKPLFFEKIKEHTQYSLVKNGNTVVVKAVSNGSSSGLTREVSIDPREYPIVQWRWKISNILEKGDVTSKDGDDYPARLYITFEYDSRKVGFFEKAKYEAARLIYGQYPPMGAINYIWENSAPIGSIVPNPYTDSVQMIITQSGTDNLNQWMSEERNIYEDYTQAFGKEPPHISGVAIMTDTDNTKGSATTYFGDILFKKTETQ